MPQLRDEASVAAIGRRAHIDSKRKSKPVKKGMKRRAAKGLHNGRASLGYRSVAGRLEVVEAEAAIARRIFTEYVAGRSQQATGRDLNREGIKTKLGGAWHQGTIAKVLANRTYIGQTLVAGEWVTTHEAIIDADTWHAAQALKAATRKGGGGRRSSGSHLFRKGMLKCGYCGESMVPRSNRGTGYEVYFCITRERDGPDVCPMPPIPRAQVDEAVFTYFTQTWFDVDATRAALAANAARRLAEVRALREQADRQEAQKRGELEKLERDYLAGDLTGSTFERMTEARKPELEAAMAEAVQLRDRERQVEEDDTLGDPEEELLHRLAQIREAIGGRIRDADGIEAVRAALLTLFDHFTLHPAPRRVAPVGTRPGPPTFFRLGQGWITAHGGPEPWSVEALAPLVEGKDLGPEAFERTLDEVLRRSRVALRLLGENDAQGLVALSVIALAASIRIDALDAEARPPGV